MLSESALSSSFGAPCGAVPVWGAGSGFPAAALGAGGSASPLPWAPALQVPVPSSVLLLTQEKPSLPLVCTVGAACFELLQQLQLSIPKAQGEPWLEQGLPRALPALPVLQFGLWAALFFPCPGAGISLLRAGFTGGYLGRVPHSSLLRT